jgi:hypothetical protein
MQIVIEGSRSTDRHWLQAQQVPAEMLPHLTEEQRRIARNFGVADETYARSVYAGELSQPAWAEKTRRLGQILESFMRSRILGAEVFQVTLQTAQGLFEVRAKVSGEEFAFQVQEDLVDELMEGGSEEALNRLQRIVEFALLPVGEKARAS